MPAPVVRGVVPDPALVAVLAHALTVMSIAEVSRAVDIDPRTVQRLARGERCSRASCAAARAALPRLPAPPEAA